MAIVRYNPNRRDLNRANFWDEFDRLTGLSFASDSTLAVDVYETNSDVIIKMPVPGIKPDDLDITITGDTVTVRGEAREEEVDDDRDRNYFFKEVRYGTFARSVSLPAAVDANKVDAETEDGMLTLTMPKAESAKPKSVRVKSREKSK